MEAHSVSSFEYILGSPSSKGKSSRSLSSSSWTHASFSYPKNSDCVTDKSDGDFSLGDSPFNFVSPPDASSPFSSPSSSPSSLSDLQSNIREQTGLQEKDRSGAVDAKLVSRESRYVGFGNSSKREGLFPPPISCLKLFKAGEPYVYLNYSEHDDEFDVEEIRIPRDVFPASREGGSLKLYFAWTSEEEDECRGMAGEEEGRDKEHLRL